MDKARRERIRQLIPIPQTIQTQVQELCLEEEGKFESRSPPSRESVLGEASIDVAFDLGEASDHIQVAIEHLKDAVGIDD